MTREPATSLLTSMASPATADRIFRSANVGGCSRPEAPCAPFACRPNAGNSGDRSSEAQARPLMRASCLALVDWFGRLARCSCSRDTSVHSRKDRQPLPPTVARR